MSRQLLAKLKADTVRATGHDSVCVLSVLSPILGFQVLSTAAAVSKADQERGQDPPEDFPGTNSDTDVEEPYKPHLPLISNEPILKGYHIVIFININKL